MSTAAERQAFQAGTYDSAAKRGLLVGHVRALREFQGLFKLLVVRDLTVRYKRSLLGVWWTLLNPLLTSLVLWVVFAALLHPYISGHVPFLIYLFSGVTLFTFFQQGLLTCSAALATNASVLTKVYVPPVVFVASTAAGNAVNFLLSMAVLLALQLVMGVGIPVTVLLTPVVAALLMGLIAGIGMLLAPVVVRFNDAHSLLGVALTMLSYLTPQFWPISIVPAHYRFAVWLNPLYSYLTAFRDLAYGGTVGPLRAWGIMVATTAVFLFAGAVWFAKRWSDVVVAL